MILLINACLEWQYLCMCDVQQCPSEVCEESLGEGPSQREVATKQLGQEDWGKTEGNSYCFAFFPTSLSVSKLLVNNIISNPILMHKHLDFRKWLITVHKMNRYGTHIILTVAFLMVLLMDVLFSTAEGNTTFTDTVQLWWWCLDCGFRILSLVWLFGQMGVLPLELQH